MAKIFYKIFFFSLIDEISTNIVTAFPKVSKFRSILAKFWAVVLRFSKILYVRRLKRENDSSKSWVKFSASPFPGVIFGSFFFFFVHSVTVVSSVRILYCIFFVFVITSYMSSCKTFDVPSHTFYCVSCKLPAPFTCHKIKSVYISCILVLLPGS